MAIEAHFAEEEVVMLGGKAGENIAVQDLFNNMVGSFGLAIHLRMVGRAVQQTNTNVMKQVLPKIAHKLGSMVRNNVFGHAKDTDNISQE